MTYQLLNTLYVTLEGAYLRLDNEAVEIVHEDTVVKRVPLHHLGAIVLLGNISVSPPLMERCARDGRTVIWLDENGRFRARVEGRVSGNVLLRRAQHKALDDPPTTCLLARQFLLGKLQNQLQVLQRARRERSDAAPVLQSAIEQIRSHRDALEHAADLDALRGIEGYASRTYFDALDQLIVAQRESFRMLSSNPTPPTRPIQCAPLVRLQPPDQRLYQRTGRRRLRPASRLPPRPAPRKTRPRVRSYGRTPSRLRRSLRAKPREPSTNHTRALRRATRRRCTSQRNRTTRTTGRLSKTQTRTSVSPRAGRTHSVGGRPAHPSTTPRPNAARRYLRVSPIPHPIEEAHLCAGTS
ncbi:MAG: hypothetical protein KatS3mg019_1121 [Fimbriimonadales bacterium]|nr:MAG: hypothetical protein KatS3mg019_1121 [Fimbriimonadales bacterium]